MTLLNGLALGDRALLWSDTAYIDPTTRQLLTYAPKSFALPQFPAAIAWAAIGTNAGLIVSVIQRQKVQTLGQVLSEAEEALRLFMQAQEGPAMARLLVAGWCFGTERARLFVLSTVEGPDMRLLDGEEAAHFIGSSMDLPEVKAAAAEDLTPEAMVSIAELQRGQAFGYPELGVDPMHSIGGQLIEHEITRDGVRSRVAKDWGAPFGLDEPPTSTRAFDDGGGNLQWYQTARADVTD